MQHCEPEDLALLALGETPDAAEAASHAAECEFCRAEVRELSRVVQVGRAIELDDQLMAPPAEVWDGIKAELAETAGSVTEGNDDESNDAESNDAESNDAESNDAESNDAESNVVSLASRRPPSRWLPTAVAAVFCLIFGGLIGGIFVKFNEGGSQESIAVVASATLDPVPGGPDPLTTGAAKLERVNGEYVLRVDAAGLRKPDGFYEVWMMDPQNAGLVAVGSFNANQSSATFPVPVGLAVDKYNSIDISDEPFDGVPGHSKVSVLRGTLSA